MRKALTITALTMVLSAYPAAGSSDTKKGEHTTTAAECPGLTYPLITKSDPVLKPGVPFDPKGERYPPDPVRAEKSRRLACYILTKRFPDMDVINDIKGGKEAQFAGLRIKIGDNEYMLAASNDDESIRHRLEERGEREPTQKDALWIYKFQSGKWLEPPYDIVLLDEGLDGRPNSGSLGKHASKEKLGEEGHVYYHPAELGERRAQQFQKLWDEEVDTLIDFFEKVKEAYITTPEQCPGLLYPLESKPKPADPERAEKARRLACYILTAPAKKIPGITISNETRDKEQEDVAVDIIFGDDIYTISAWNTNEDNPESTIVSDGLDIFIRPTWIRGETCSESTFKADFADVGLDGSIDSGYVGKDVSGKMLGKKGALAYEQGKKEKDAKLAKRLFEETVDTLLEFFEKAEKAK